MKTINHTLLTLILCLCTFSMMGQSNSNKEEKSYLLTIGAGYFGAILNESSIAYENAQYQQNVNPGFSYYASVDYIVSEHFSLGLGYNGEYASAEFIENAVVNGEQVNGFLEAGAVANGHVVLNMTYTFSGVEFQPYVKMGLGYFKRQVELGDIPLSLTNNVEVEIFPDYKYSGLGLIPELGVMFRSLRFSAGYSLPFGELKGEDVPGGYESQGSISSSGVQITVGYRFPLF